MFLSFMIEVNVTVEYFVTGTSKCVKVFTIVAYFHMVILPYCVWLYIINLIRFMDFALFFYIWFYALLKYKIFKILK